MATENQIAANRQNARLSHGPVTNAGKAAVRLNALKHGLRARQVVLPCESQEDFDQHCRDLEFEWQPATPTESACLEQIAIHLWKLARAERQEAYLHSLPDDPPARVKELDRIYQIQLRLERAFHRSLRELQKLQKDRRLAAKEEAAEAAEGPAAKAVQPPAAEASQPPPLPASLRDTKHENLRHLFPTFVRECQNPAPHIPEEPTPQVPEEPIRQVPEGPTPPPA
jgi:hypothetical protein